MSPNNQVHVWKVTKKPIFSRIYIGCIVSTVLRGFINYNRYRVYRTTISRAFFPFKIEPLRNVYTGKYMLVVIDILTRCSSQGSNSQELSLKNEVEKKITQKKRALATFYRELFWKPEKRQKSRTVSTARDSREFAGIELFQSPEQLVQLLSARDSAEFTFFSGKMATRSVPKKGQSIYCKLYIAISKYWNIYIPEYISPKHTPWSKYMLEYI